MKLFFYWKFYRIDPWDQWTGSTSSARGSTDHIKPWSFNPRWMPTIITRRGTFSRPHATWWSARILWILDLTRSIEYVMDDEDSKERTGIPRSNLNHRILDEWVRSNRGEAAAWTERSAAFHDRPTRAHRSSTRLDLQPTVWGCEEFKTERIARGGSQQIVHGAWEAV
jgi:hypothetical protein